MQTHAVGDVEELVVAHVDVGRRVEGAGHAERVERVQRHVAHVVDERGVDAALLEDLVGDGVALRAEHAAALHREKACHQQDRRQTAGGGGEEPGHSVQLHSRADSRS